MKALIPALFLSLPSLLTASGAPTPDNPCPPATITIDNWF